MTQSQNQGPVEYVFQAEMSQLLHLITHSLYSHREIFLRELISNASDALSKLHFEALTNPSLLAEDGSLKIEITLDENTKTLTITDNGIGMDQEELIQNLGTIAKSGTASFVSQLTGDKKKDLELIGRFGVGFYSVFMVADEVSVTTRSSKEAANKGFVWTSKGTGTYQIREVERQNRGTEIRFQFKEEAAEFASSWKIKEIIKKYSDFVSFPILFNSEAANQSQALWAKPKSDVTEEQYKEFFQYLSHSEAEPLAHLHLAAEAPVQFKSLLFVPTEPQSNFFQADDRDSKVNLYVKKVFIQSDCKDLLPAWLRFVVGVVDSEDLSLNVSREVTQKSGVMEKINSYLTKKLLGLFSDWATKEPEKYETFWKGFANYLKEGLHTDYANRDKLLELYRAASSTHPKGLVSLADYVGRMKPDQTEIYYVSGKNLAAIESSPNLEYFKKHQIEVLYLFEEIDEFVLSGVGVYQEKPLMGIDKAGLKIETKEEEAKHQENDLQGEDKDLVIGLFKKVLGDRVADVIPSSRLVDSPATLVAPQSAMSPQIERMMKAFDKGFTGSKRVMEINLSNPLIQNLAKIVAKAPEDPILTDCVEQLFEGASLLEGNLEDPTQMVPRANRLMNTAVSLHLRAL